MLPELGVGITYSSAIEPVLDQWPDLFDVVEVEPQTTWLETRNGEEPYRVSDKVLEHLDQLPGRKLVHSVGTPVGGTVRPDPRQLVLLRRFVERLEAPWASDHLGFNATPEFKTAFFLPPRQTPEGVETATTGIRDLQQALHVPIAVETGVNYLKPRPGEMPDGAFVAAVLASADCGILLDLHNIFANGLNGRQSLEEFLNQLPLDRVWEVHLAGGFEMDGFWLDSHSGAIPDPLFDIAKQVLPLLPNLKAIIFEIFPSFVPLVGFDAIRGQVEKLHELWELRGEAKSCLPPVPAQYQAPMNSSYHLSPEAWERALGGLVIGRPPEDNVGQVLAEDPGVGVISRLIHEFRASMIVNVLRLSSRLMMLALGPDIFRAFLNDFWAKTPPLMFASSEAEAFAKYLEALDLKVPQLAKILEFERAVVATFMDEQPRVVVFDSDPLPMLRGLAEGRLVDPGQPGQFEIEVTPNGSVSVTGLDLESVQQVFPYH
jgi:uncharacterized protein (UPF0276 family)